MAIFVVIAMGDPKALGKKIKERFPDDDDQYAIEAGKWLVFADRATANTVAARLGMNEADNIEGLVVTIVGAGYNGYASGDIWEWIRAKAAR